ncbi:MAG: flagellar export protein FliJ [Puniceicoccaceae bacterium]
MKRFKFTLESVLALRHFRKMEAAGELSAASRFRQIASSRLERGHEELESLRFGVSKALSPSGKAAEVQRIQAALLKQKEAVTQLRQSYLESVEKEAEARKAVLEAQREYKALLKLESKQRERARKEADKEDEKVMQEFVSAQHVLVKGG